VLSADSQTYDNLKKLWGLCRESKKPVIVWVGAGVSSWLGYERWPELANRFHRSFLRSESSYPRTKATKELEEGEYAAVFQRCRDTNSQRYLRLLAESFQPRPLTAVYGRFLSSVSSLERCTILTTNVDEMLERSLPEFGLVQRSDLAQSLSALTSGTRLIGKLHGSISSVQSAVFATQDYSTLLIEPGYIDTLRSLLTVASVVFIGYSLRDQYLFDLIQQNASGLSLFGDGPHFLVSSENRLDVPSSVNIIQYQANQHTDHRSGLLALELLDRARAEAEPLHYPRSQNCDFENGYFIGDLYSGGAWATDSKLTVTRENGDEAEMFIGPDWFIDELPKLSTASHDLAIGLICFDRIFLPVESVNELLKLVGSELFWELALGDIVRLVKWEGCDSVMVLPPAGGFGCLATGRDVTRTSSQVLKRKLKSSLGQEIESECQTGRLDNKTVHVDLSTTLNFADVCTGLFVSPATRKLLGLSESTPVGHIPRWLTASAIRLVQIARIGATCQILNLSSMKLMTGAAEIAREAFSVIAAGTLARDVASYTLTGQFGVMPSSLFDPKVWKAILNFRDSATGANLRASIHRNLRTNGGAEIVASVDAGLKQGLPTQVLEAARTQMSAFLIASSAPANVTPSLWTDAGTVCNGPRIWRANARRRLDKYLQEQRIGMYDSCPCGSCEKVKFCCVDALQT
jgi:hypothetical protein